MYSLILENEWKQQVELTHNEDNWQVTNVDGLNSPPAVISSSTVAGFDGAKFSSSRLDVRNIVITFVINGNVEKNTIYLNSIVMPKRAIRVYYRNHSKGLYVNGYVESFEYNKFSQKVEAQISIICPQPYWMDEEASETVLSYVISLFEFPIAIPKEGIALSEIADSPSASVINYGNVECGLQIEIEASQNIILPTINNLTSHQHITLNVEMQPGDRILINTIKGQKSIRKDCNCEETNVIDKLEAGSSWINLLPGENRFSYNASYGKQNMKITIKHRNLYGGV